MPSIDIRKAFWWGRNTSKTIDEESSSSHSGNSCQADQDHAPRIALPLLAFFLLYALKLFDASLQKAIFVKAWESCLFAYECLRQVRTPVESVGWLSTSLALV